jgi:TRAP-type uncharacterized transport system fused permease subunit
VELFCIRELVYVAYMSSKKLDTMSQTRELWHLVVIGLSFCLAILCLWIADITTSWAVLDLAIVCMSVGMLVLGLTEPKQKDGTRKTWAKWTYILALVVLLPSSLLFLELMGVTDFMKEF